MMNCNDCTERLIDYRYRELGAETERTIADHLAGCSACAIEYCRLDADLSGIAPSPSEAPAPRVQADLRAKIERRFPRRSGRLRRLLSVRIPAYQPLLVAAAAVAGWFLLAGPDLIEPNTTTAIEEYDAGMVVVVDPRVL